MALEIFHPKSLKARFSRFVVLLIVSLFTIAAVSNYSNRAALNRYNDIFIGYDQLLSFYENVETMNQSVLNYIYTGSSTEITNYEHSLDQIKRNITRLKETKNSDLRFRFSRLGNMILTYEEMASALNTKGVRLATQKDYDSFRRLKDLIIDTNPFYTQLLTEEMKYHNTELLKGWHRLLLFSVLIGLSLLVMAAIFVVNLLKSVTQPIEGLVNNIDLIKGGQFDIEHYSSSCTEIESLLSSFNEMAQKVDSNIKQIQEKQQMEKQLMEVENENLRISQLLTESQLVAMQHQMNPHFLFNTLSTISKLAYLEGAQKSSGLMIRASRVLRYGLEMSNKTSNLALEINSIEDYFEIQRIRMGERIKFNIEVRDNFSDVLIPGMILQPLIENCIIHGVQEMVEPAFVSLSVEKRKERVFITIEDNGSGIDEKILDRLNANTVVEELNKVNGEEYNKKGMQLGIQNVRKRLELFYKGNYRLFFESELGCGTVITLDLPNHIQEESCLLF